MLSPQLEQQYRAKCWHRDVNVGLLALSICAVLLFQALWNDAIMISNYNAGVFTIQRSVVAARLIIIIYTVVLGGWLFTKRHIPSFSTYEILLLIWQFLNGALIIFADFSRPPEYYGGATSQVVGLLIVYLVLPQHNMFLRTLPPLLCTLCYLYIYAFYKIPPPYVGFTSIYFGFISVNIMGIIFSHLAHSFARRQFVLNLEKDQLVQLLAKEKTALEEKKKELEQEKELVARYQEKLRQQEVQREKLQKLQAQIKPHFLYNTLSTIAYYCRSQPEQAYKLIGDLSIYLQSTFKLQKEEVAWEQELELVRAYLAIEAVRMEERLTIHYKLTGNFTNCYLPPFTIQPLVENAVRHGLAPLVKGGVLEVSGREEAAAYYFVVRDNGTGILPEKQADLLVPWDKENQVGIGLANVHQRLQGLYGRGLSIDSQVGKGTAVSFFIPKKHAG